MFSAKTLDFLFQNRMNDNKIWFSEHKDEYIKYVRNPLVEFVDGVSGAIGSIDSEIVCGTRCISRIYRDTRFSKDKSIFRDYMWIQFNRKFDKIEMPALYFSIFQEGFSCGCGFYQPTSALMDEVRLLVQNDDKHFRDARKFIDKQNVFSLEGDLYKKNHFPDEKPDKLFWLNRKNIYIDYTSTDFELLFSSEICNKISENFTAAAPFYSFLLKAAENTRMHG